MNEPSPIDKSKTTPLDAMTRARIILDVCSNKSPIRLKDAIHTGNQMPHLTDEEVVTLAETYLWWDEPDIRKAFPLPDESWEDYKARYNTLDV